MLPWLFILVTHTHTHTAPPQGTVQMLPWLFILVTHTRAHTLPDSSSLSHTHTHTHSLTLHPCHTYTHTHTHTRTHPRRQALFWPLLSRQGSWTLETGFPTQGLGTVQSAPSEPSKTNALLWQFGSGLGEVAWAEFLSFDIRLYWMLCVSHSLKKKCMGIPFDPPGESCKIRTGIIPILQMRKLEHKMSKVTAKKWRSWDWIFFNWKNNAVQFCYLHNNYEIPKRYWSLELLQKSDMGRRHVFQLMINIFFQSHECLLKNTPEI